MRVLDPEIVGTFIDEVNSHIQNLDEGLLFIAAKVKSGEDPGEKLHELFRSFHSIKGASGLLGFTRINRLTHKAETLLEQIRNRQADLSESNIQVLFSAVEGLSRLIEELKTGRQSLSLEMLLMEIEGAMKKVVEPPQLFVEDTQPKVIKPDKFSKPAETFRVELNQVDVLRDLVNELVVQKGRLSNIAKTLPHPPNKAEAFTRLEEAIQRVEAIASNLSDAVRNLKIGPIGPLFRRFSQVLQDLAKGLGKEINLNLLGEEIEVDRHLLEELSDPLNHLIRNAADHGIESPDERKKKKKSVKGNITLKATEQQGLLILEVTDDGKGINREVIRKKALEKGIMSKSEAQKLTEKECVELIFHPGFSTIEKATNVSGRGVGMDIVKRKVDQLNGHIEIITKLEVGTTFKLSIPLVPGVQKNSLRKAA